MSIKAINWARKRVFGISASSKNVLASYADHANEKNESWPGAATLASETGLSVRQVKRSRRDLERRGLLELVERGGLDGESTAIYRLSMEDYGEPPPRRRTRRAVRGAMLSPVTTRPEPVTESHWRGDRVPPQTGDMLAPKSPSEPSKNQSMNERSLASRAVTSDPEDDPWGIEAWCRSLPDVMPTEHPMDQKPGNWIFGGAIIDYQAKQVMLAARLPKSWRGNLAALEKWTSDQLDRQGIVDAITREASHPSYDPKKIWSIAYFDKAVRRAATPEAPGRVDNDPNDAWGVEAWCRSLPEVEPTEDPMDRKQGNWAVGGTIIDYQAKRIMEATRLPRSWRGDLSPIMEWLGEGISRIEMIDRIAKRTMLASYDPKLIRSLSYFTPIVRQARRRAA